MGRLASPLALFYQGAGAVGPRRAAVLAAGALLYAPAAPAALGAVRLWRASALLGGQLLAPWLARALPPREAAALRACAAHNALLPQAHPRIWVWRASHTVLRAAHIPYRRWHPGPLARCPASAREAACCMRACAWHAGALRVSGRCDVCS